MLLELPMVTGGDDDVKNIFEMLTCGDLI